MTSEQDLIVSVVRDYGWKHLRAYATSLVRTGFKGTKLMFVDNIGADARENLASLGFTVIDFKADTSKNFVVHGRFAPVVAYLKENHSKFRYAIWTDTRDLAFQTNPSEWMENNIGTAKLLGSSECVRIQDEPTNDKWLKASVGAVEYAVVRQKDILCGGTLAGTADRVSYALSRIYDMLIANPHANDQALLSYLLHTELKAETRVPKMEEGFVANFSWFNSRTSHMFRGRLTDTTPSFNTKEGVVYTSAGKPFCIIHEYDREKTWNNLIQGRNMPRVLIAILSWSKGAVSGENDAQRRTFLKDVARYPNLDYRFFIGDGTPTGEPLPKAHPNDYAYYTAKAEASRLTAPIVFTPAPDEVILHVPDDYYHLSYKTRGACRYANEHGFDYIFKIDTDTYVNIDRLMNCGFENFHYLGRKVEFTVDYPAPNTLYRYAGGGSGYFLDKYSYSFLLDRPSDDWAEDRWVGGIMKENGIEVVFDPRFSDYPKRPQTKNDVISSHLATPPYKYSIPMMYSVHEESQKSGAGTRQSNQTFPHPPTPPNAVIHPCHGYCRKHKRLGCAPCSMDGGIRY